QRNGFDPQKVFIVRNGPDLRRVKLTDPDASLRSKGRIILGYVGAMNPQDGVDYLLRALRRLVHDLGRTDFYCVLIGDGDSKETRTSAGDAALYVTPNDEAEFAQAIARLMDDPMKRREMGEVGRARIVNDLSWHVTSKNLLRAYAHLFPPTRQRDVSSAPAA